MKRANASVVLSSLLVAWLSASAPAAAQGPCFTVAGRAAARAQHLVALNETVRLSASCEYSTSAAGPWSAVASVVGRDVDFLEVHSALASSGAPATADPRVVLGRRRGAPAVSSTLMLRYCAHYLLEEQLGFRVVPSVGGGSFRIERVEAPSCDAEQIELRAVRDARAPRVYAGASAQTLGARQPSLELPEGDWSIFAARPGSAAGLRVGVFRSQRVVTPLAHHLRTAGAAGTEAPPLFAMRWDAGQPGLLLHPTEHAMREPLLWPELRTAADAGFLWVTRPAAEGARRVVSVVQLEGTDTGAMRLPDTIVRDAMREIYGDAGDALAPTASDWEAVRAGLELCLTPSYVGAQTAGLGGAVPDASLCASLGGLSVIAQAAQGAGATEPRVCLSHGMQVMRVQGASQVLSEPGCFRLPPVGAEERPPLQVAVAGGRIEVQGQGLCVLLNGALLPVEEGGGRVLRAGLLEIRQGGGEGCAGRQGIARLRMPVIDPQREWHPVGLFTGGDAEVLSCPDGEGDCPWQRLAHDERDVFAYVKPRHELEFALTTSPQVAAAINADPTQPVQITQDVPLLSGITGPIEGARVPALVAHASRDRTCPSDVPFAELRARPPLDPDELLADATFHVFLLSVTGPDEPTACLARASFRVRPSRALVAETVEDFLGLELGLLGDTQAVVFANDPVALGLALPLVWFRMSPGIRFLTLEVTGGLVMAASFDPAELSRVGAALTWALSFGIPEYLPRILSVGGMLHGAAETSTVDNPIVSFFVGLNLSTLVDLAGGR